MINRKVFSNEAVKKIQLFSGETMISKIPKKIWNGKYFRASENVYVEIFEISDFGLGFKACNVLAALLLPIK